jgi:2,3-bisphosphoglycerate-independent phosphoglycerate mutase
VKVLFIFLDGVGLGQDDPEVNPFARLTMPNLTSLLGGHKLISDGKLSCNESGSFLVNTDWASLMALDACLGVNGIPQSATGQASLVTGINVSARLGAHEGPKPTPPIVDLLSRGTLLNQLHSEGKTASLLNAFPPRYFESIESGHHIPGVIALSVSQAGFHLKTQSDLFAGNAISADFTAEGWRTSLGYQDTPVITPLQAGERLRTLAQQSDLSIFEYWLTDIAGHHQDMPLACALLETLDTVFGSLLRFWDYDSGLILLTSDHGNLEDLSTRRHTRNHVPLLVIGTPELRGSFTHHLELSQGLRKEPDLTDIAPAILRWIG